MIKTFFLSFISACIAILTLAQENKILKQLEPLKGTWKGGKGTNVFYETWRTDDNRMMSGMSYKLKGTDTIVFEWTKIIVSGSDLSYVAKVKNQNQGKEVAFKLVSHSNKTFVFENPEHDFPQRVIYQLISSDSLHAWIEGKYQGKESREDYYYQRVDKP